MLVRDLGAVLVAVAWAASPPSPAASLPRPWLRSNGSSADAPHGIVDEDQWWRLGCWTSPQWAALGTLLASTVHAGGTLAASAELVGMAEQLLEPFDSLPREFFADRMSEFHAAVAKKGQGKQAEDDAEAFCFPGYLAACLVRVASLAALAAAAWVAGASPVAEQYETLVEANAKYCLGLFGRDASLDYLASVGWPVSALDFELRAHGRLPPAAAAGGAERYEQLAPVLARLSLPTALPFGSVDPQGVARRVGLRIARALPRPLLVVSVDGGHCALWLELAVTLRSLFPGQITSQLATYKGDSDCLQTMSPTAFDQADVFVAQKYFEGNAVLRRADVLICQWVGECAKLRSHYSKPVIAYIGFLPLNDPSVGAYHYWSEPLQYYWERLEGLLDCDVHGGGRGWRKSAADLPPADGGPPCAVVWEEPQLAEAAYWQLGVQLPSVRPLALYVGAQHRPEHASNEVLVVNRGRLARDVHFTEVVNALRHASYPYRFVDQMRSMPFSDMARRRAAILLPWDLNLVMFHDLYAMNLPLFLPDRAGLHYTAFAYFKRFLSTLEQSQQPRQPWSDVRPGRGPVPHPFSPFDANFVEPREYWLGFTEYLRVPHVGHFASVPDLLLQVFQLDGNKVTAQMRAFNERCRRESRAFWLRVLGAFERRALRVRRDKPRVVLHFTTQYGRSLCWGRGGMSAADCCSSRWGSEGNVACFDDFWTYQRCCVMHLRLPPLDDAACGAADIAVAPRGPKGGPLMSPVEGRPWVQEAPSVREPFVFLWDEKCGGTSFMTWLKYSVHKLGKLRSSLMYTTPGHPVAIGTPFLLKTISPEVSKGFEIVAGQFDWRLLHEGIGCKSREMVRCMLLVRHPVDRFISYYLERTDRRFEREVAGNRSIENWTDAELRQYLASVSRERMWLTGEETGTLCNKENLLCVDRLRTRASHLPELRRVRPKAVRERLYFRYLGGPQNRLAWILDPERGDPRLAIWRMRRCVVGLQAEDFDGFRRVLGWHFPWIHELRSRRGPRAEGRGAAAEPVRGRVNPSSGGVRSRLSPSARALIARFNWRDMRIYRAARQQFRRQLRRIDAASGGSTRWPPVAEATEDEVQSNVSAELQDLATFQVHDSLNRYMLGY